MTSRRREQRAWYAFGTTIVTALFGPYLTELVRAAASPNGRVEVLGLPVGYRAVWEWLLAVSVAAQALAMPLVGAVADHGRHKTRRDGLHRAGATVGMHGAAVSGQPGGALNRAKGDDAMQRIWSDMKNHPPALALFMVWWVALALLNFVVSRRTQEAVAQSFYVAPAIAGALVCWWRRSGADRITVGTMAGATVLVIQFALMLPRDLTEAVHRGKGLLGVLRVLVDVETLAFGALACIVGAVTGFLAALAVVVLAYLEKRRSPAVFDPQSASDCPRSGAAEPVDKAPAISGRRIVPRPALAVAGGLVLLGTVMLAPEVYGRSVPPPPPFTAINMLVAIALLAPVSLWNADAGRALVLIAGLVSFSIGLAVLVGVGFKWAEWSAMLSVAMSVGGLAELGAGVLALATAFRKWDVRYAA